MCVLSCDVMDRLEGGVHIPIIDIFTILADDPGFAVERSD